MFVSSTSVSCSNRAFAITDHSQSAKGIDPYLVLALCGGARSPKTGTHFMNGLSKLGERAHDRN